MLGQSGLPRRLPWDPTPFLLQRDGDCGGAVLYPDARRPPRAGTLPRRWYEQVDMSRFLIGVGLLAWGVVMALSGWWIAWDRERARRVGEKRWWIDRGTATTARLDEGAVA